MAHHTKDAVATAQNRARVLVTGATGGSGDAIVGELMALGHRVTAFSRHASRHAFAQAPTQAIDGDVLSRDAIGRAVRGQDVVIVCLGISENPVRVRLFGSRSTAMTVRSAGTANVIEAMHEQGVNRLLVQSSFGVGETRNKLGLLNRLFFTLVLKPQIRDTEHQEALVRASGLDWVLVQPVHLVNDKAPATAPYISTFGETRRLSVARRSVARFVARAILDPQYTCSTVAVSG